jgi:hypothetical protein
VRFRRESKGMQDYPSDAVVGGHRRLECWGLRTGRVGPACHPSVSGGIPGEAGDGGGPSQGRGRGLDQGSGPQPQPSRAPSSHPRAPIAEHWAGPLRAGGVPARPCRAVVMADRMRSEGCPDPSRSLGSAALERYAKPTPDRGDRQERRKEECPAPHLQDVGPVGAGVGGEERGWRRARNRVPASVYRITMRPPAPAAEGGGLRPNRPVCLVGMGADKVSRRERSLETERLGPVRRPPNVSRTPWFAKGDSGVGHRASGLAL